MALATIVALALPLVMAVPAPPERRAAIAAQLDDRPSGTVRLQCTVDAQTILVTNCTAVAPGETLAPDEHAARSRVRAAPGSLADIAVRLADHQFVAIEPAPTERLVLIDQPVDLRPVPLVRPSAEPALNSRTAGLILGPGFADATAHYPAIALRAGVAGRIVATCRIGGNRRLRCFRASYAIANPEIDPSDIAAYDALVVSTFGLIEESSAAAATPDGQPTAGRDVTMAITWALPG